MKSVKRAMRVAVVTSVMLSFVSFWRAAAIVLNDLGSSAFYVGGIAEQAVGHAAPWFIFDYISVLLTRLHSVSRCRGHMRYSMTQVLSVGLYMRRRIHPVVPPVAPGKA